MNTSILKSLCEMRMHTEFEHCVIKNEYYQAGEKDCIRELNNMMSLLTTPEQTFALDTLIGVYNVSSGNYGLIAYEQGFKDGIRLLLELRDLVTDNK